MTYGVDAVQVMTENPYRLSRDVRGMGFRTADAVAMRLGVEKTDEVGKSELARLFEIHRLVKGEGDAGPQPDHRRATTNQFTQ